MQVKSCGWLEEFVSSMQLAKREFGSYGPIRFDFSLQSLLSHYFIEIFNLFEIIDSLISLSEFAFFRILIFKPLWALDCRN